MKEQLAIKDEVIQLIANTLSISPQSITEASGIADLSADSIQLFELLLAFERTYRIETSYDDIMGLRTVGDIILYITRVTSPE